MANISLVKPDKSMYSMAIDCVVEYLKNKELKVFGGSFIESLSYSDWLDIITSVYFIFDEESLIGFAEFKDLNTLNVSVDFSLKPSMRNNSIYSSVIEELLKMGTEHGCSSLSIYFSMADVSLFDYVKVNSIYATSLHLSDTDVACFNLQLS